MSCNIEKKYKEIKCKNCKQRFALYQDEEKEIIKCKICQKKIKL